MEENLPAHRLTHTWSRIELLLASSSTAPRRDNLLAYIRKGMRFPFRQSSCSARHHPQPHRSVDFQNVHLQMMSPHVKSLPVRELEADDPQSSFDLTS